MSDKNKSPNILARTWVNLLFLIFVPLFLAVLLFGMVLDIIRLSKHWLGFHGHHWKSIKKVPHGYEGFYRKTEKCMVCGVIKLTKNTIEEG